MVAWPSNPAPGTAVGIVLPRGADGAPELVLQPLHAPEVPAGGVGATGTENLQGVLGTQWTSETRSKTRGQFEIV